MRNTLKILLPYLLSFNFLYAITDCKAVYNCSTNARPPKNIATELTCSLPAMPNMQITAADVFDANGALKYYFGTGKTVCDVLGWMNEGASKFSEVKGMDVDIDASLDLVIKHLPGSQGGLALGDTFILDNDSFNGYALNVPKFKNKPDGNRFALHMDYITVHEFFHIAQHIAILNYANIHEFDDDFDELAADQGWVLEGTARMFEDIVYDEENPYLGSSYRPMYNKDDIEDILSNITLSRTRYKTFIFWKLLQGHCNIDLSLMLSDPLKYFHMVSSNCIDIPDINNDKLAGAFVLYNRAMILYNDVSLIESDEPSVILRIDKQVVRADKPNFSGSLDLKSYAGSSLPAFSAKSFLITHETLASDGDMNLTFKANGDLKLVAVRVKADGSSDINDNFVMDSNTQTYKLTELDRAGGLFVTLVNTTDKKINIEKLKLEKKKKAVAEYLFEHNTKDTVAGKYDLRHWETGAVPKEFTYNNNGKMGASGIFFNTTNNDTWLEAQGDSNWGITSGNASFSFWVKMVDPSSQSASSIFGNGAYPRSGLYGFEFKHSNAGFIYEYQDPYLRTGGHAREYFKNTNILPNEWNHVVVVFESTKIYPRVYLNSIELVDIDLWVDAQYDHPPHKNGMQQHISTQHGNIGMTDIYSDRFIGELDTFRVYDYPLSQTEIDVLFEEGNK